MHMNGEHALARLAGKWRHRTGVSGEVLHVKLAENSYMCILINKITRTSYAPKTRTYTQAIHSRQPSECKAQLSCLQFSKMMWPTICSNRGLLGFSLECSLCTHAVSASNGRLCYYNRSRVKEPAAQASWRRFRRDVECCPEKTTYMFLCPATCPGDVGLCT